MAQFYASLRELALQQEECIHLMRVATAGQRGSALHHVMCSVDAFEAFLLQKPTAAVAAVPALKPERDDAAEPSVKRRRSSLSRCAHPPPLPAVPALLEPAPLVDQEASQPREPQQRAMGSPQPPPLPSPVLPTLPPASLVASLALLHSPFVAPPPGLWRERYAPCCPACFSSRVTCLHFPEVPLRLLLIGHNPSDHAWESGFPYSNPSNRLWGLMRASRVVPPSFLPSHADTAPSLGVGITDVGCVPGSDAAAFKRPQKKAFRSQLFASLAAHLDRCAAWAAVDSAVSNDGAGGEEAAGSGDVVTARHHAPASFAPLLVAFTGKRQWAQLFDPPLVGFEHGAQCCRPPGWPLPACTEVWVLPSTSGRAVITAEQRAQPYEALGRRVAELPWPREKAGVVRNP